MAGKIGMKMAPKRNSMRQQMWRTMRIKRRFDLRDLLVTVPGAKADNARRLLNLLEKGGYVEVFSGYVSGRPGARKGYRLMKDAGPDCPVKAPSVPKRRKNEEVEP